MFSRSKTYTFESAYVQETATIAGLLEHQGPLSSYFDQYYTDAYMNEKSFEKAERRMQKQAFERCLYKANRKEVEVIIGGDLTNQLTASSHTMRDYPFGFIGVYSACATSTLQMGLAAFLISSGLVEDVACLCSSHNGVAERQFRYPVEYGIQKPETTTFTATGAACMLLGNAKTKVRVKRFTLGKVVDYKQSNVNDMGRVMAPAAYETLSSHFNETNTSFEDYDLVLTGDLSKYGKRILVNMSKSEDRDVIHYQDCGTLLYDIKQQPVFMGGSGIACLPLVAYGMIYDKLKKGEYKRVLLAATGALMSPTTVAQKETIPSICHVIELEGV